MTANDLPSTGFIDQWFRAIQARLDALAAQQAQPGGAAEMLTIDDVTARLRCSRSTVQRWFRQGKMGRYGRVVKLQVLWFTPSEPRIPAPALLAFGQGLDFDLATLQGIAPPAPAAAPPLLAQELPPMRLAS